MYRDICVERERERDVSVQGLVRHGGVQAAEDKHFVVAGSHRAMQGPSVSIIIIIFIMISIMCIDIIIRSSGSSSSSI